MEPEVTKIVRNRSSREGASVKLIVLHTTEGHDRAGLADLQGLAGWFDNPASSASSHVANDEEGNDARYVPDAEKAWTCCNFNSVSLNLEQIGFASFSKRTWIADRDRQLKNTARWIAHWHREHRIPIRKGGVVGSVATREGVVGHANLGAAGCGHDDPGGGYPLRYVLQLALYFDKQKNGETTGAGYRRLRRRINATRRRYGLEPLPA